MAVYGGKTATSTLLKSCRLSASVHASFCTRTTASWWLRFIFQFPAISGVRLSAMSAFQDRDAGQFLALEVLQAGATSGGDVPEGVLREAELAYGGRGVAATDDGEPVHLGQGLGDCPGPRSERVELEDAHGSVPEHRPGTGDRLGERGARVGPDVEPDLVGRDRVDGHGRGWRVGLELRGHHDVG